MKKLFSRLDACNADISLDVLITWLQETTITDQDVERFVRFRADRYQRNLMHAGPGYHVLVLCWRSGQRSPIHDHTGSGCAVKVLRGVATETLFARGPNDMVYATGSRTLTEGQMCASKDSDIHQISNLQPDGIDLITLHLYSPPLLSMNVYSLVDRGFKRYFDPINEDFTGGSGI